MTKTEPDLNTDQVAAVASMIDFINSGEEEYFVLQGYAGTGKTTCMKELAKRFKGRLVFTAPTNKATKVLRRLLLDEKYIPECRTIYSLLGLRLEPSGAVRELVAPEDPLDLSEFVAVIVDEASMVNAEVMGYISRTAETQGIPFIFLGDPGQLPPVKELVSPVWELPGGKALLTTVVRHKDAILQAATSIRDQLGHPAPKFKLKHQKIFGEKTVPLSAGAFNTVIRGLAESNAFLQPDSARVVAWRNVTVSHYNAMIRECMFPESYTDPWLPSERVLLLAPAKTPATGDPLGTTDDEGLIEQVSVQAHSLLPEYLVYSIRLLKDENTLINLEVIHPESRAKLERALASLAERAKVNRKLWKDYWALHESFHQIRHAYALTAHRAQGSTYDTVLVDWRDILLNRNREEAFRCLYVAATRARKELWFN